MIKGPPLLEKDEFVVLLESTRARHTAQLEAWIKDAIPPIPPIDKEAQAFIIKHYEDELLAAVKSDPKNKVFFAVLGKQEGDGTYAVYMSAAAKKLEWFKHVTDWANKYVEVQQRKNGYEMRLAKKLFFERIVTMVESIRDAWNLVHPTLEATFLPNEQFQGKFICLKISSVPK